MRSVCVVSEDPGVKSKSQLPTQPPPAWSKNRRQDGGVSAGHEYPGGAGVAELS